MLLFAPDSCLASPACCGFVDLSHILSMRLLFQIGEVRAYLVRSCPQTFDHAFSLTLNSFQLYDLLLAISESELHLLKIWANSGCAQWHNCFLLVFSGSRYLTWDFLLSGVLRFFLKLSAKAPRCCLWSQRLSFCIWC